MSSTLTKKSVVSAPGRVVKTPCFEPSKLAPMARMPPTSAVISGAESVRRQARSTRRWSARDAWPAAAKLRKPSAAGSSTAKDATSVCSCEASVRPGVKGTFTVTPAAFAACSTPAHPASTMRSASEICFFPPACAPLNSLRTASRAWSALASSAGWLAAQSFCGARRRRAPLAPPRLSVPRNVDAEAHAVDTSCATERPQPRSLALSAVTSCGFTRSCVTAGTGSCQMSASFGTSGPR